MMPQRQRLPRPKLQPLHEEISDLLSHKEEEDRFASPLEARKKAMDFLARREYGQTELIKKLADKGFERDVAAQAVTQLTEEGLQSDQRFAESFVQSRINQGKGPVRIRLDLGQRGISEVDDRACHRRGGPRLARPGPGTTPQEIRHVRAV